MSYAEGIVGGTALVSLETPVVLLRHFDRIKVNMKPLQEMPKI